MTAHLPALVTLFAVLLMFGTAFAVGVARGRYKIAAPATSTSQQTVRPNAGPSTGRPVVA